MNLAVFRHFIEFVLFDQLIPKCLISNIYLRWLPGSADVLMVIIEVASFSGVISAMMRNFSCLRSDIQFLDPLIE